jgi:hypothetical protein
VHLLVDGMTIDQLQKLCHIVLSVPAAMDAAVAHLGFATLKASPQHCILCHKNFSSPGGCKIEQISKVGYDRGECPKCREWDNACGPCQVCHQPHCEDAGTHNYCYTGVHISNKSDLPAECTLDLDVLREYSGCKPCIEQFEAECKLQLERKEAEKRRREIERQQAHAERQLQKQAASLAAAAKK